MKEGRKEGVREILLKVATISWKSADTYMDWNTDGQKK